MKFVILICSIGIITREDRDFQKVSQRLENYKYCLMRINSYTIILIGTSLVKYIQCETAVNFHQSFSCSRIFFSNV